jgi:hypothetical protein
MLLNALNFLIKIVILNILISWKKNFLFLFFFLVGWDWVYLVHQPLIGLFYQSWVIDDECGVVGGIMIGRGNRSTRRKPDPVSLYPPQIPHYLTWTRTGSRRGNLATNRLIYGTAIFFVCTETLLPRSNAWTSSYSELYIKYNQQLYFSGAGRKIPELQRWNAKNVISKESALASVKIAVRVVYISSVDCNLW